MQKCNITKSVYIVGFILTFLFFILTLISPIVLGIFEPLLIEQKLIHIINTVYDIYGLTCHQRPERSFHLLAVPMPLCVRCFGMALGMIIASIISLYKMPQGTLIEKTSRFFFLKEGADSWWVVWISCLLLFPMGLDWFMQQISDYNSPEFMRLTTGILVGYLRGAIFLSLITTFCEKISEKRRRRKLFEEIV